MNPNTGEIVTIEEGKDVPKNLVAITAEERKLLELVEEGQHERGAVLLYARNYKLPGRVLAEVAEQLEKRRAELNEPSALVSGGVCIHYLIPYVKEKVARLGAYAKTSAGATEQAREGRQKRLKAKKAHAKKLKKQQRRKAR